MPKIHDEGFNFSLHMRYINNQRGRIVELEDSVTYANPAICHPHRDRIESRSMRVSTAYLGLFLQVPAFWPIAGHTLSVFDRYCKSVL